MKECIHDPFVSKSDKVNLVRAGKGPAAEDCKEWWPWKCVWDNFKSPHILDQGQNGISWDYHKSAESPLPLPPPAFVQRGFLQWQHQNEIMEWTGHKQCSSGVTVPLHPQMEPSVYRKTSPGLPLILSYTSCIATSLALQRVNNRHKLYSRCSVCKSSQNHSYHLYSCPIHGKFSTETGPWCQKVVDCYTRQRNFKVLFKSLSLCSLAKRLFKK